MSTGQIVGELSLLADGRRTATVRATAPSTAWVLERSAFDVLRRDVRSPVATVVGAIGSSAVQRLERLYRRFGTELGVDEGRGAGDAGEPGGSDGVEVEPEPHERAYLASTLFFGDFEPEEVAQVTRGLRRLAYERGMLVAPADRMPEAVWIVARGAVETSIRGAHGRRVLRLAGPGRAAGHLGLLGDEAFVAGIQSRARERAVLLEVPWTRVHELLAGHDAASRRFAAAFWRDAVRALQHGERPLARMSVRAGA
jgi:CRP-like cAMP-binding protein